MIDNDNGAHMRPLPGIFSFVTSGPSVRVVTFFLCIVFLTKIVYSLLDISGGTLFCHCICKSEYISCIDFPPRRIRRAAFFGIG